MKTQEIAFTTTKIDGDAFTVETARNGKAVVIYNANRTFGTRTELPAGCGVVSRLAEIALTVAGMSILGEAMIKEMEIEILKDIRWDRLEAVARVIDSEEDFITARCEIRVDKKGRSKTLVARACGTICTVKRPFQKADSGRVVQLSSSRSRAAG